MEDSSGVSRADFAELRTEFSRFMMLYQFGISELMTKVNILKDEFTHINQYSPIEHVTSRVKSPDSILRKAQRLNVPLTIDDISKNIFDIAGVRITCSFISDTYRIAEMLTSQTDLRVIEREDYIAEMEAEAAKLGIAEATAFTAATSRIADAYAASDLVLQLSRKPESFGRTVIEALSVGRPVLGWAHGGVGELLAELQPQGAARPFDEAALLAQAEALLAHPPSPLATMPYTLRAMQNATLDLYQELAVSRARR